MSSTTSDAFNLLPDPSTTTQVACPQSFVYIPRLRWPDRPPVELSWNHFFQPRWNQWSQCTNFRPLWVPVCHRKSVHIVLLLYFSPNNIEFENKTIWCLNLSLTQRSRLNIISDLATCRARPSSNKKHHLNITPSPILVIFLYSVAPSLEFWPLQQLVMDLWHWQVVKAFSTHHHHDHRHHHHHHQLLSKLSTFFAAGFQKPFTVGVYSTPAATTAQVKQATLTFRFSPSNVISCLC